MKKTEVTLACLALLGAHAAHAQHTEAPEKAEKPVATVEVKASADTLRRNDTASRTVVTREEILKYGDSSVLDSLKRVPGVTVAGSGVRMRGLGNGYTQVLVNGERPPAGFSLETLSPELVEKIEVIRAATAEYSTQSVAGTINVVLRKVVSKRTRDVKVYGGGGTAARASGLSLGLADKAGKVDYSFGANFVHNVNRSSSQDVSSAYYPASGQAELRRSASANENANNDVNAFSRISWAPDPDNTLSWQAFAVDSRSHGTGSGITTTEVGPDYPYPNLDFRFDIEFISLRNDLNWVARFRNGSKLDTKAGIYAAHNDLGIHRRGWKVLPKLLFNSVDETNKRDNGVTWTGKYSIPMIPGHALAVGWDAGHSRHAQGDARDDAVPLPGEAPGDDASFDASIKRLAFYAQDEWDLTPRWSMYLGARWEGMYVATQGRDIAPATSRYGVFSPLMQTLWKLPGSKGGQVRFALTRTYRAPELSRLVPRRFRTSVNTPISPDYAGNPNLKPELATGFDTAYEHYFESGAMVSASATAREINNVVRTRVRLDGTRWVSLPDNLGRAHSRSVELEGKLPLKSVLPGTPEVELRASASRNWSRADEVPGPDNRLERQPAWSANMGLDYKRGSFSTGANLVLTGGGWTRNSAAESSYSNVRRDLDSYALYKLDGNNQVRLSASNLLAQGRESGTHYEDESTRQDNASVGNTYRTWRMAYEHKF